MTTSVISCKIRLALVDRMSIAIREIQSVVETRHAFHLTQEMDWCLVVPRLTVTLISCRPVLFHIATQTQIFALTPEYGLQIAVRMTVSAKPTIKVSTLIVIARLSCVSLIQSTIIRAPRVLLSTLGVILLIALLTINVPNTESIQHVQ
jgi:hypothetical protein